MTYRQRVQRQAKGEKQGVDRNGLCVWRAKHGFIVPTDRYSSCISTFHGWTVHKMQHVLALYFWLRFWQEFLWLCISATTSTGQHSKGQG